MNVHKNTEAQRQYKKLEDNRFIPDAQTTGRIGGQTLPEGRLGDPGNGMPSIRLIPNELISIIQQVDELQSRIENLSVRVAGSIAGGPPSPTGQKGLEKEPPLNELLQLLCNDLSSKIAGLHTTFTRLEEVL